MNQPRYLPFLHFPDQTLRSNTWTRNTKVPSEIYGREYQYKPAFPQGNQNLSYNTAFPKMLRYAAQQQSGPR